MSQFKLIRKYCKRYNKPYKAYKEAYKRLAAKEKFEVLANIGKALK